MSTPVMTIRVHLDPTQISHMDMPDGAVTLLPFTGTAESDFFNGTILPGACDVQTTNAAGVRHMCAQYMIAGKDKDGNDCHIFIENHGYFERNHVEGPYFEACPIIRTDSPTLRPYLQGMHFRAEGHGAEYGVNILIFDTEKDD